MSLSAPSLSPALSRSFLQHPRRYRLVDLHGNPHPVLDDLYDTHEAAWAEALNWCQEQAGVSHEPIGIGVEVSTASGGWRTLRPPGA